MLKLDLQLFGGRGASSVSGGGSGGKTQTEHMNKWSEPPSLASQLANSLGISENKAQSEVKSVQNYSGSDYGGIRDAQYNGYTTSPFYKQAMEIEDFIKQSPKWAGGELYRGLVLPTASVSHLKVGAKIDMKGMSSWSSAKSVADDFADHGASAKGKSSVIFRTAGTKQGTSITHLSILGKGESEVLISGKATWTITGVSKVGKVTIVDVKEN